MTSQLERTPGTAMAQAAPKRPAVSPWRVLEGAALVALFGLVAWQVLAVPLVGVANSGDFERVMGWGALAYETSDYASKYFGWINRSFAIVWPPILGFGGYLTSEALFVKLAACLARPFGTTLDIRVLGMVHATAFIGAIAVLMAGWKAAFRRSPLFLLPGLALLLADNGYMAYFNSLYSEPATMVFLPLTLGTGMLLASARSPEKRHLVWFFASAAGLMTAKMQNATLALPLLLFAGWLYWQNQDATWRRRLKIGCLTLVAVGGLQYVANPPNMTQCNEYSAVFNGILHDSPTPREDLRALGLDEKYAILAGTNIFMTDLPVDVTSEAFERDFYAKVSHKTILAYYLTHPARLFAKLGVAADRGFFVRPGYLGSFERATGRPAAATSDRYSLWSRFKLDHLPHTLPFVAGYGFALAAWLVAAYFRPGGVPRGVVVLLLAGGAMLAVAFVTPVLGDGHSDIEKHMFLFNLLFDTSLTLLSAYVLGLVAGLRPSRGETANI